MQTMDDTPPPSAAAADSSPPFSHGVVGGVDIEGRNKNNARYKMMSPGKLPITRTPCLTIPPGLSPTSFLESPVFLSNFKGEPSPTTGSLFKHQMMYSSSASSSTSLPTINSSNGLDVGQSSSFEFKPNAGSFSMPGFSFSGSLASSADRNQQQAAQPMQTQVECHSPSPEPSIAVKNEVMLTNDPKPSGRPEFESNVFNQRPDSSNEAQQALQCEVKVPGSQVVSERTSEDGYNWRKYGQKLVKGSEFPRSYYKCTHPNCEVKKLFERSPDGQITEIIYKGTHDHPKPQPNRRLAAGSMMSSLEEKSDRYPLTEQEGKLADLYCQTTQNNEGGTTPDLSPCEGNDNTGDIGPSPLNGTPDDVDEDDPLAKRRRMEIGEMDITSVVKPIREPRVVVQTVSEVDILDDGYRWRKYGQKVVRGNPNPRSYYKCTYTGCPVRKHVERASHDPKAVITTYEGKHNHEVPTARNSNHDSSSASNSTLASRMGSHDTNGQLSLHLSVGQIQGQTQHNGQNLLMLQPGPFSSFPVYVNGGMVMYDPREN